VLILPYFNERKSISRLAEQYGKWYRTDRDRQSNWNNPLVEEMQARANVGQSS